MKIAFVGDIALFGCFSTNVNSKLYKDLEGIREYLTGFDIVVGNLETPFSIKKKHYGAKSAYICSDIENINILKYLNISVVNLANNHMFDFGQEGLELTKKLLETNDIKYFGVEGRQLLVEKETNKLAFGGYCCYSSNPLNIGKKGINGLDVNSLLNNMDANDENGYLNVLSIHAGQEHVNYPDYNNILFARMLANKYHYIYYGHHPHVIQGYELCAGSPIFYSLGNFCFDDVYTTKSKFPLVNLSENNRKGLIATVEVDNNAIREVGATVIHIGRGSIGIVDNKGLNYIKDYSEALLMDRFDYCAKREKLISTYIMERRNKRNLSWYVKRMNFTSVRMLFNTYKNSKKYEKAFLKYLHS